ncbi:PepSY-associated TM helix domain-containing protein [Phenylobacterium sp.]|uniref:PepSY-associated TM helix domain-containing protein n=1 Tax=Phenylobacterium sp. TaxID=1871053 RepID=UPI0025D8EEC4|nr:PepSY-associated TM helix domain-containing protein [Phenylobacterium sp.]
MSASELVDAKAAIDEEKAKAKRKAQRRAALMRQMVQWHWISAAVCLVGMLLFAITGITLNHAGAIEAKPNTVEAEGQLPADLLSIAKTAQAEQAALPEPIRAWLAKDMGVQAPKAAAIEWSDEEAYVSLPRPGGDGWVTFDAGSGAVVHESTTRGPVAYLNDLHKGRNTGAVWSLFLDIFAIGCVVFCITGLVLLQLHSRARKITWPLVGLGLAVPLILVLIFIH